MGNRVGKCMSILVVFVTLSVWGAATALSQTMSLDDQVARDIGDRVTFTLSIDYPASESGEIQDVSIDVGFDQTVLTYDGHTRGSLVENWPVFDVANFQEGQLRVAGLAFTSGDGLQPGDSGVIVQLRFSVNAMANTTLTIFAEYDLATFDTRNGQFRFEPHICQPDGDIDQNGSVTAADALLAFQHALGLTQLDMCQRSIAEVFPQPTAPDGNITASDALCIFQKALSLPSCLDSLPSPNQPPIATAGADQIVDENTLVILSGSGSDSDGTIASYTWTQTDGMIVSLTGAATATAAFVSPDVSGDETLTFQLTVTDDAGAQASDEVRVTVRPLVGMEDQGSAETVFRQYISGPIVQTRCVNCHVATGLSGHTRLVFVRATDAPDHEALNLQIFENFLAAVEEEDGGALILNKIQGVDHGGGVQVPMGSAEFANMQRFLARMVLVPTEQLMVSLSGIVTDYSTDIAVADATVSVTQYRYSGAYNLGMTTTDDDGAYEIQVGANPGRVNIKVEAEDFVPQSTIVNVMEGMDSGVADPVMVPVGVVHGFQPAEGVDIEDQQGQTLVSIPPNSLVTEDGTTPAGNVTAMVTVFDAVAETDALPGDFIVLDADTGTLETTESLGAIDVRFVDDNGESLNLKFGQEASVMIPLAKAIAPEDAPPTASMFYWSDERGYWIEEGEAALEQVGPEKWVYVGRVKRALTWSVKVMVLGVGPPSNRPPVALTANVPEQITFTGTIIRGSLGSPEVELLSVDGLFSDPDNDLLKYELSVNPVELLNLYWGGCSFYDDLRGRDDCHLVNSNALRLSGEIPGSGRATVTAYDPDGLSASVDFEILVPPDFTQKDPGDFYFHVSLPSSCPLEAEICFTDLECEDGDGAYFSTERDSTDWITISKTPSCETISLDPGDNPYSLRTADVAGLIGWWGWGLRSPRCRLGCSPDCFVGPKLHHHPGRPQTRGTLKIRTVDSSSSLKWHHSSPIVGNSESEGTIRVEVVDTGPGECPSLDTMQTPPDGGQSQFPGTSSAPYLICGAAVPGPSLGSLGDYTIAGWEDRGGRDPCGERIFYEQTFTASFQTSQHVLVNTVRAQCKVCRPNGTYSGGLVDPPCEQFAEERSDEISTIKDVRYFDCDPRTSIPGCSPNYPESVECRLCRVLTHTTCDQ